MSLIRKYLGMANKPQEEASKTPSQAVEAKSSQPQPQPQPQQASQQITKINAPKASPRPDASRIVLKALQESSSNLNRVIQVLMTVMSSSIGLYLVLYAMQVTMSVPPATLTSYTVYSLG